MRKESNYIKLPTINIEGYDESAFNSYELIVKELKHKLTGKKSLVIDCYPGVRLQEIIDNLIIPLGITEYFISDEVFISGDKITEIIKRNLSDDRVFGIMSNYNFSEFIDYESLNLLRNRIESISDSYCIIGCGASLIDKGDIVVYADLARWEIQQRYRSKELGNWKCNNYEEDVLKKYKRGFFFEWRMADRHKQSVLTKFDYLLDTNNKDLPGMITSEAFHYALKQAVSQPFRVVPFFDPGVWGGQWMKEVCDLDRNKQNFAWCFDGVPEENSLLLKFNNIVVQIPSIDLVFLYPRQLLGERVHARFGREFPIRFDFLDTMDGQNLSLQVHPLTEYIQDKFGMHYTQDESYYILDAKEEGCVYLGVKNNTDKNEMFSDLRKAEKGSFRFPDEKYINRFPAKKHDHFLIPAGTIHCSGTNSMILEISATPFIFTFKLWDWDRVGLDGIPRPVHIDHGEKNAQFDRDTDWVEKNLINCFKVISQTDNHLEESTGLHEREFIETRRHTFDHVVEINTNNGVQMLNLIEGRSILIESVDSSFEAYEVHYAETFIIPASINKFRMKALNDEKVKVIQAYVR